MDFSATWLPPHILEPAMATIRKRVWTTASGEARQSWQVDFTDQHGRRVHRQFQRKKDADAWLVQARGQVGQGTFNADSNSITVAEAAGLWLERCEQDALEPATMTGYRSHVRYHIEPLIGAERLSRLSTPRVEQFRDELLAGGRSRALAKKALGSLKAIVKEAQRRGLVSQNAARDVTVRTGGRHKKRLEVGRDIPTPDEIRERLANAKDRWRPLLVTAVYTGLRSSELRGLAWEHVDFMAKMIRVRQRADQQGRIGPLKSATSRRDIPMTPTVANTLKAWKLACPNGELGLVFPNTRGNVESHANIVQRGIGQGLHRFRHFFASWLIDLDFGPKRVQTLMGHASIQMTFDVYGHLFPQEDDHDRFAAGELALIAT
jgi:integrase